MSRLKTDAIRNVNASVDGITLDTSGNVAIPNELQLADKIVHTGDTNTAIRFLANDTVSVETGAAERFRITSDGSVMFGSGVPSEDLHLKKARANFLVEGTNDTVGGNVANINVRAPYYRRAGYSISDTGGNEDFWIGRPYGEGDSNAAVAINMGGAEKLRLFHSGDFCIGRNSGLSNAKVSIQCDAAEAGIAVQLNASSGTSNLIQAYSSAGPNVASICVNPDASPDLLFKLYDGSNTVERVRIKNTGEVGINCTPTRPLHIVGNDGSSGATSGNSDTTVILENAGTNGSMIEFLNANNGAGHLMFTDPDGTNRGRISYHHNGDFFRVDTSGSEKLRITSAGKVGISDTNPQSKLAVSDAGSTADPVIMAHVSGSNGSNLGFGLYSSVNSKYTFKVTNNGRVQVNDGIDFSLTSHASGMTSELLSDYEEGTWTPNIVGHWSSAWRDATHDGTVYGRYVKVGNLCYIYGYLDNVQISGNAVNTHAAIWNLPFNHANTNYGSTISVTHSNIFSNCDAGNFYIGHNTNRMYSSQYGDNDYQYCSWSGSDTRYMMFSGCYQTS